VDKPSKLRSSEQIAYKNGTGLAVRFNMAADTSSEFDRYIEESGKKFQTILDLSPENGIGEAINEESCIAYARDAKNIIRETANKYGVKKIDLFYAGPLSLAVIFGQLLNAMPDIQCYEQKNGGGYSKSCLLSQT
jgi:hypothetical protein